MATSIGRVANSQRFPEHLAPIDARTWPSVVSVPTSRLLRWRASRAEAHFAAVCAKAELRLEGDAPDLSVDYVEVFDRIAASGWVGLAEGYMAGEWRTPDSDRLVAVLRGLVEAGYRPPTLRVAPPQHGGGGQIPPSLVQHYAGDGVSPFQGHFATGVPTRERVRVKSWVPRAGRGAEPATHFVDNTEIGAPLDAATTRADLADAQERSVNRLVSEVGARERWRILEYPAAGPAATIAAAARGAETECVTLSEDMAAALREQLTFAGVSGHVRAVGPNVTSLGRDFDAAVSLEHLETLSADDKAEYLTRLGKAVAPGGRIALQATLGTDSLLGKGAGKAATAALASLRAYVWPGLSYVTPVELAKLVDRRTPLRVIGESHAPDHLARSLALQRSTFETHLRDAAADGFDPVFRRLWVWQLALRQALAELELIDLAQVTLTARNRRGRR